MEDKRKCEMWRNICRSGTHNDRSCHRQKGRKTDKVNKVIEEEVEHSFVFTMKAGSSERKVGKPSSLLVNCGATRHIITDKPKFTRFDSTFNPTKHYIEVANGTRANNIALMRRDGDVVIHDKDGNPKKATLTNPQFIPSHQQDIFSEQATTDKGASTMFQLGHADLTYKDGTEFNIEKDGRL